MAKFLLHGASHLLARPVHVNTGLVREVEGGRLRNSLKQFSMS